MLKTRDRVLLNLHTPRRVLINSELFGNVVNHYREYFSIETKTKEKTEK